MPYFNSEYYLENIMPLMNGKVYYADPKGGIVEEKIPCELIKLKRG